MCIRDRCVCVCVSVCVRACVRVRACVCVCVRARALRIVSRDKILRVKKYFIIIINIIITYVAYKMIAIVQMTACIVIIVYCCAYFPSVI